MNLSASLNNQKIWAVILVLVGLLAAIFIGLISVTANPILIGLSAALIVGGGLIIYPAWIIWLILILGLLVSGLLPLYFDFLTTKIVWGLSLLGLLLFVLALSKILDSSNVRRDTPAYIWVALGFVAYALINTLIQWHSAAELLGGFKRYFQVWGLLFALCWIAFDERDIHRWRIFLLITALIQLPFALYERIVYVPIRESIRHSYPGMVPIDVVSGTFGASYSGGGASAEMAIFLIITLAFMLARQMEKVISIRRMLLIAPLIVAPIFLGEIKAVIIMFPLMFLVLYRDKIFTRFHSWLLGLIIVSLLTVAVGYSLIVLTEASSVGDFVDRTLSYNVKEVGHGNRYLNRTTVLLFWAEQQGLHDPVSFIFGNGLGSAHAMGHIDERFPGYGIGLTTVSMLLWELGLFGFCFFVSIIVMAWFCAEKIRRETIEPLVRADAIAIQVALVLFSFYLFYRSGIVIVLTIQIIFATLLGYLGWLHRKHTLAIALPENDPEPRICNVAAQPTRYRIRKY